MPPMVTFSALLEKESPLEDKIFSSSCFTVTYRIFGWGTETELVLTHPSVIGTG